MDFILKIWLSRGKTRMEKYKLLNDYANWTSKYYRKLYLNYCRDLENIRNKIKEVKE